MKYNVYSIRDIHVGFMQPTIDQNNETAKRNFALMVCNNPGVLGFRPADFDLYHIGEFDSDSGMMIPSNPLEFVINGANAIGE